MSGLLSKGQAAWIKVYDTFDNISEADKARMFIQKYPHVTVLEVYGAGKYEVIWSWLLAKAKEITYEK